MINDFALFFTCFTTESVYYKPLCFKLVTCGQLQLSYQGRGYIDHAYLEGALGACTIKHVGFAMYGQTLASGFAQACVPFRVSESDRQRKIHY